MFAGSHLLTAQKPVSECYVIDGFIGMIVEWSEYCVHNLMQSEQGYNEGGKRGTIL